MDERSDDINSDYDYLNDFQESNYEVEFQAINLSDELMDNDLLYYLPKHHRCAVHTLNLIATVVCHLFTLNFYFILI